MVHAVHNDQRINSKLEQVASLRELATKATATLRHDKIASGTNIQSMEDTIAKMIDLEAEINRDIDHLVDTKREIVSVIKRIPNPEHQTLLELRYLCFKTWEQIAVDMRYTIDNVFKLHNRALNTAAGLVTLQYIIWFSSWLLCYDYAVENIQSLCGLKSAGAYLLPQRGARHAV